MTYTARDLERVLTRYEGAVSVVEGDSDTSDEAMDELAAARSALLAVLREALSALS